MKRLSVIGLILLLGLGLVWLLGCGGGTTTTTGGGETTASEPATTPTTGGTETTGGGPASGEAIPIGVLLPYTGEMGAFGTPMYNAAKMAAQDINDAGGVLGRPISLSTEDDRSSVEEGIKAARKMIGVNKVVAIAGPFSDIIMAVWPIAKQAGVMTCSEAAGTTKLDVAPAGDWVFRTVASDSFDGKVAANVLLDNGFKKIAVIYENDEGRISISDAVKEEFKRLGGEIVADVAFAPRAPTYSAELKKVADSKPEAVWLGSGQESAATLFKDAKQRGYAFKWMISSDIAVPEMFQLVGNDVLEGVLSETPAADTSSPAYKDWADRFDKLFSAQATGGFQSNSYDQIVVLALAMQAGGEASGKTINDNYRKIANPPGKQVYTYAEALAALKAGEDINYEGVSGPLDFNEFGNVAGSYESLTGKNGKWESLKYYSAADLAE